MDSIKPRPHGRAVSVGQNGYQLSEPFAYDVKSENHEAYQTLPISLYRAPDFVWWNKLGSIRYCQAHDEQSYLVNEFSKSFS